MKLQGFRKMIIVLMGMVFLNVLSAHAETTAEEYFKSGLAYAKQGNWFQAISSYTNAIKIKPDLTAAYFNRGNAYFNGGNYDGAILDYTKTSQLKPNFIEAYDNRAAAYINKGNNDQAILDCSKVIALNPDFSDAYNNRGTAYYYKKEYDKAWADIHTAEKLGASIDPPFLKDLQKASGRDK